MKPVNLCDSLLVQMGLEGSTPSVNLLTLTLDLGHVWYYHITKEKEIEEVSLHILMLHLLMLNFHLP